MWCVWGGGLGVETEAVDWLQGLLFKRGPGPDLFRITENALRTRCSQPLADFQDDGPCQVFFFFRSFSLSCSLRLGFRARDCSRAAMTVQIAVSELLWIQLISDQASPFLAVFFVTLFL